MTDALDWLRVSLASLDRSAFFNGWSGVARTLVVGALAYVALVAFLRVSGKRTLAKMNAFDLVVTVALGSTLATILLNKQVALLEGLAAFLALIGLQYAVAWLALRSSSFRRAVKSEPRLLLFEGAFLDAPMRSERVTREEVLAALRAQGVGRLEDAAAVVLETDGGFTVLSRQGDTSLTSLAGVSGAPDRS